jgi:steroid delta-isomerase-like uncharacterized protein
MTTTTDALSTTRDLAERYGAAWNDHDVDAILAMHADDAVFHLHMTPFEEAADPESIRAQFEGFFAAWPDLHFHTERLTVREDLFVHEFTISGTLAAPFPVGDQLAQPTDGPVRFAGVDVIPCENGRLKRKDTYLDAAALRAAVGL